jgi:integrase
MRSVWVNGKEDRKSLGHADRDLAERQAYELLALLMGDEKAVESGNLTLGALQRLYLDSTAFSDKKPKTRQDDEMALDRVVAFFGPNRTIEGLTGDDVRDYVKSRRRGDERIPHIRPGRPVRDRTIEFDLVALRTMLNWGAAERNRNGRKLLLENPLRGVALPKERNPKRPVATHADFEKLCAVAADVHPLLALALIVAEGTGRRLSAWRQLRWTDVDLEHGVARWAAENDKKGFETVVPLSTHVRAALREARNAAGAIGEAWVFPAPEDSAKPCSRHFLDGCLRRAYKLAGVQPQSGSLWHAFRRKWATERKHLSLADVAAAGGWKNSITLQLAYQQPDSATMEMVVENPVRLVSEAQSGETNNATRNAR